MAGQSDDDDTDLFRKAMQYHGVRKTDLNANRILPPEQQRQAKIPRNPVGQSRGLSTLSAAAASSAAVDQTEPGQPVLFVRNGADKNSVRKLKRNELVVDETIDLHGLREHEATRALSRFLSESRNYRWQCIQIIHGKGRNSEQPGGVLRPLAIHWLKQQPEVIAFCSATPRDGGTGATNVLLNFN